MIASSSLNLLPSLPVFFCYNSLLLFCLLQAHSFALTLTLFLSLSLPFISHYLLREKGRHGARDGERWRESNME